MRAGAVNINPRNAESLVAGDGQLDHGDAGISRGEAPIMLVRRIARGDEIDDLQPELIARFLGQDQMPDMDRIERPAQHPDT